MIDVNTRYEIKAYAFNLMTGHMAPGKDSPAALGGTDYEERERAWRQWNANHGQCVRAMIMAFDRVTN